MKKERNDRNTLYEKKEVASDTMFEIDDFYFEKEYRRKKREITQKKKNEKRKKEDRWN